MLLPQSRPRDDPNGAHPAPDPLLRFTFPDARSATLRLGEASTVLAVGDVDPSLSYGRRAAGAGDLQPLTAARSCAQRETIARAFRPADPARPPRLASYDIREFVY